MSTPKPLIIIGAGEHARVIIDAVLLQPQHWQIAGIAATDGEMLATQLGVPWFPDDAATLPLLADVDIILGVGQIGVSQVRPRIASFYDAAGASWATVIHPSAILSPSAVIAPGSVVFAGAVINPGAQVGPQAIINTRSIVEHDCQIGAFACLAPGVVLGGGVKIGDHSFLGLACCVRDHCLIGSNCIIGMGAVVTRDIASDVTALGNPAQVRLT